MSGSPLNRLESHWPAAAEGSIAAPPVDPAKIAAKADDWRKRLERLMGDHPQVTVVVAAVAGIALGWFVKRK